MPRSRKNRRSRRTKRKTGNSLTAVVRISGREFIGTLNQSVTSNVPNIIGQNVQVNDASFSLRLNNLAKNFIKWRLRRLVVTQMADQNQTITGAYTALDYRENPDAATPTTLDQMISGNGMVGGSQDHVTVSAGSSEWLNCRVGVTNTDIEFYVSGAIYSYVVSDGTRFMNTICLAEYTVEFKDPV
jgi:hypothetical protein